MKLKQLTSAASSMWKRLIETAEQCNSEFWIDLIPATWLFVFFILPLLIVFKVSFSEAVFGIPPFTEIFDLAKGYVLNIKLNFANYITILQDSYYITAFINSIYLSITATVLCFLIGFPMAYGIHSVSERFRTILLLLVSLSFWTSFLIRVYSWMSLLSVNGILNSILIKLGVISEPIQFLGTYYAVCTGFVFCYLPFMIFPVYGVLEKIEQSYIESAYDLGCHPTKTFWTIIVPLAKPGIVTGSILVFSATIGEFVIPELLGSAETVTIGRVIWNEFFCNLDWPMACALSIATMFFVLLPIYIVQRLFNADEIKHGS